MPEKSPPSPTRIIPFLYADRVGEYLEFLSKAFGFETRVHEVDAQDPEHEHAETLLGGALVMISHASPKWGAAAPRHLPARHGSNYVYVPDVDAHFRRARAAGATIEQEPADMPWGDRTYTARDPEGHQWFFASPALPDLAAKLGPLLERVPEAERPLLVAIAERLAAERYRGWAREPGWSARAEALLACAEREDEIAERVEALYPGAHAKQREILARSPELTELNRAVFAKRALHDQLRLQARGERLGAATWRAFARSAPSPAARDVFLACAELEEASASVLESFF
jgi:uncharacterized glyoxalase superfamily protein PhnB